MRWMVVLVAVSLALGCGKKASQVSALERTKAHGGMNAVSWTDRNGENRAVFTIVDRMVPGQHSDDSLGSPPTFSRQVRVELTAAGKPLQVFTDAAGDMFAFEASRGLIEASLGLTDLDHDGVGELTFAYLLDSTGGPSVNMVLVVLEGGDRYVLRGSTLGDLGHGETEGGAFEADAAMKQSPFFGHARAVWAKIRKQEV